MIEIDHIVIDYRNATVRVTGHVTTSTALGAGKEPYTLAVADVTFPLDRDELLAFIAAHEGIDMDKVRILRAPEPVVTTDTSDSEEDDDSALDERS